MFLKFPILNIRGNTYKSTSYQITSPGSIVQAVGRGTPTRVWSDQDSYSEWFGVLRDFRGEIQGL